MVIVTVFGAFAGAGGAAGNVAVVPGWAASIGAAACGTAITGGVFLAMCCRSAGATATAQTVLGDDRPQHKGSEE